jgi:hypothetical protein
LRSGDHAFVLDAFTSEVNKHSDFHTRGFSADSEAAPLLGVIALGHFDLDDHAAVNEEICMILTSQEIRSQGYCELRMAASMIREVVSPSVRGFICV